MRFASRRSCAGPTRRVAAPVVLLWALAVVPGARAYDCPDVAFTTLAEARVVVVEREYEAALVRDALEVYRGAITPLSCAGASVEELEPDPTCGTGWTTATRASYGLACDPSTDGYGASGDLQVVEREDDGGGGCDPYTSTEQSWTSAAVSDPSRTFDPVAYAVDASITSAATGTGARVERWEGGATVTFAAGDAFALTMLATETSEGSSGETMLELDFPACGTTLRHIKATGEFTNEESWEFSTPDHLFQGTLVNVATCSGSGQGIEGQLDGVEVLLDYATWEILEDNDGDLAYGYWGDCDDTRADVSPCAVEVCDGVDNNCDGQSDEDWFVYDDTDGDGYGDPATAHGACVGPGEGEVDNALDCDDSDPDTHPGAWDPCGGDDKNCDGEAGDWGCYDMDGDGHGSEYIDYDPDCVDMVEDCDDCDDSDPNVYPGAEELPNGKDDDCDPTTDDPVVDDTGDTGDQDSGNVDPPPPDDEDCGCASGRGGLAGAAVAAAILARTRRRGG